MDVGDIPAGRSFPQVLDQALAECDVLLALIGLSWLPRRGLDRRRLDDPDDLVRIESDGARARGLIVVPVLVQNTTMPARAELPEPVAPGGRPGIRGGRLPVGADMLPCSHAALLAMLDRIDVGDLRAERAPEPEPVPEPVPRVEPEPATRADSEPEGRLPPRRRNGALVVGILAAVRSPGGGSGGSGGSRGVELRHTRRGTITVGMIARCRAASVAWASA